MSKISSSPIRPAASRRCIGWAIATSLGMSAAMAQNGLAAPPVRAELNQEAAWPQRFQLGFSQPGIFGFAASQPGTVTIDVQAPGGVVDVALAGLSGASVHQAGQGAVRLVYQITAQDIQKSSLWQVRVTPQSAGTVAGMISIQHPPANSAAVQSEMSGLAVRNEAPLQQRLLQPNAAIQTALSQAQSQIALFERQKADAIVTAHVQAAATVQRLRALPVLGQAAPATHKATPVGNAGAPPANQQAAPTPTIANARVTAYFDNSGRPLVAGTSGMPVLIIGTGFGTTPGYVRLAVDQSTNALATINSWSDTVISIDVPSVTKVLDNPSAQLYLGRDNLSSSAYSFPFQADREMRTITSSSDRFLAAPQPMLLNGGTLRINLNPFSGMTGVDTWLTNTHLENQWVVSNIALSNPVPNDLAGFTNGSATLLRSQTGSPDFGVQWSVGPARITPLTVLTGAFAPSLLAYGIVYTVVGPKGMPDGLVVVK